MTGPVRDREAMIRQMAPRRRQGSYVFATVGDAALAESAKRAAIATFAEDEGLSLVLPAGAAAAAGLDATLRMACLTLSVPSALDGVGLTAAVAGALAARGIPCNVIAAFHHDHVFVPEDRAEESLQVLEALGAGTGAPPGPERG